MKTFNTATKCNQCTSLMVGIIRQGCTCEGKGSAEVVMEMVNDVKIGIHLVLLLLQSVISPVM